MVSERQKDMIETYYSDSPSRSVFRVGNVMRAATHLQSASVRSLPLRLISDWELSVIPSLARAASVPPDPHSALHLFQHFYQRLEEEPLCPL